MLWSLAGYVAAIFMLAMPIAALFFLTRKRRWHHRIRWAGEVPVWWRSAFERDLPPELLDPPDSGGKRR